MIIFMGIIIALIISASANTIERRLRAIETQNNRVIEILEDIRDQK